jgi:endo-1,4-beta-xylanase
MVMSKSCKGERRMGIRKRQNRILSVFMMFFMLFSIIAGSEVKALAAEAGAQNLLSNGDFENVNNTNWFGRGGAKVAYTTDEFHGGTQSLKVTGRTKTWEGPMVNLTSTLVKGKTYHIAIWLKYNDGPASKGFNLMFENSISGQASYAFVVGGGVTRGQWTLIEGDYKMPDDPNLTAYSMYIEVPWKPDDQVTSEDTMDFYIDDAVITETVPIQCQKDIPQMREVYKDYFPIGAATSTSFLDSTDPHSGLIGYQYGVLVAGNAMKPASLQPTEGNFYWTEADKYVDFAEAHNMLVRGHTLLWHSQVPDWFFTDPNDPSKPATRDQLLARLKNHISTVVGRYKGKIDSWDVVNEVLSDGGGLRGLEGRSKWKSIIGDVDGDGYDSDYIELAFKYAHEADPNAKLIINDYGLESSKRKRDDMYNLVKRMLEKGIPVDGIGLQMHISMYGPSVQDIKDCIDELSSLKTIKPGFTIQVTEMDMSIYQNDSEAKKSVTNDVLMQQAYKYRDIFNLFKEEAKQGNLGMVVLWGMSDDDSWLDGFPVEGRTNAPLLFDRRLQAKPAYWALVDPTRLPVERDVTHAANGTPSADGAIDNIWGVAKAFNVNKFVVGNDGATAKVKTMWDSKNLYVMVNVTDSTPNKNDGIEIYIDKNFDKAETYQSDDKYYVINSDNSGCSDITHTVKDVNGGYIVQAVIPISDINPTVGGKVGIDFKVNDDKGKGTIDAATVWNDTTNNQKTRPINFGDLIFDNGSKLTYAVKGTPSIDGTVDDIWKNAVETEANTWVQGSAGSTAKIKTLWDERYLYVLADVTDNNISKISANPWEQDSVEIFMDQLNEKSSSYDANDAQYRINFDNEKSYGGNCDVANFKSATSRTSTGYIVEAAVPLSAVTPQAGSILGVDFQVNNDANNDGTRDSVAMWCDPTGMSWSSTSRLGNVMLINEPIISISGVTEGGLYNKGIKPVITSNDTKAVVTKLLNGQVYDGSAITAEGSYKLEVKAEDSQGNLSNSTVSFKLDMTAPDVTLVGFENGSKVVLGSNISVNWSAADSLSGLATASAGTVSLDASTVGKHTKIITAADKAGNINNYELTYYVVYQYSGILEPIKADGSSSFKAGSTIPVKFSLTDVNGKDVSTALPELYISSAGDKGTKYDEVAAVSSGSSNTGNLFRYDSISEQYIFNLSTKNLNLQKGEYQITIKLDDRQSYTAEFYLK